MNKYLLVDKSKLLKTKLDRLALKLQGSIESTEFRTKEEFLFEAIRLLGEFYKGLNEPQLEIKDVRYDDLPDASVYNKLWEQLLDDLIVVFTELENIESLTVANFNFITTEANRLTARLKAVSSKLGDYILYSVNPLKDAFYFKDSFNDLSKLDSNSALLNADQCEIGQAEGIVTLPIDKEKNSSVVVKESPIINPDSNGTVGNNQELGARWRGDMSTLLDNNPDSWFEYERVVTRISDDKEPLILDITVNLGENKVVNHIRVNPNNFGTKTVINVDTIETSLDGQIYTNIKDDIPIAGFVTQDEENIFQLAPSTSKYAGQGLYTFTPRKVKYIHFVFHQTEPYLIETSSGNKLRYVIGIRDIDIQSLSYKPKGEIVSLPFQSEEEVRKVLLESNQNPAQLSNLASIDWFVSPDDGQVWHQIQPKEFTGIAGVVSVPEVLEFNGVSVGAISTAVPVKSLRVKAVLGRTDDNFTEGSSSLNKVVATKSELHSVPDSSPFKMDLEEPPVDGTVVVVDPLFGSRGMEDAPYVLGHTTDRLDLRKYRLPFADLPRPIKKVSDDGSPIEKWHIEQVLASEWQHLEVGGKEWSHADQSLSGYGSTDEVFTFNPNTGVVEFGDNTTGKAPAENEPITTWFDAERLYPSEAEDDHVAQLEFSTSATKSDMTVKRYDKVEDAVEVVPRKATVIRLKNTNITDITNITSAMVGASYEGTDTTFLNGRDELTESDDWSIDLEKGIIYTLTPTSDTTDLSLSYKYQPIYELTVDDWGWATANLLRGSVSIKESAWKTISIKDEDIKMEESVSILDVAHLSVVKGTLSFDLVSGVAEVPDESNPFRKEVTFQNGITELGGTMVQATEQIATHGGTGKESFSFSETVTTNTSYSVTFTNTDVFATEVGSEEVTSNGKYYVDRVANEFFLYWDTAVTDPGKVAYYYENPNFSEYGLYSIDYKLGRIYTQITMNSSWVLKASYEYVDFRAEYRIARLLSTDSYDIDITNKSVIIKDNEILKYLTVPHGKINDRAPYYLINYDYVAETREDVEELTEYFSPIIKDYALKILTRGKIY